MEKRIELHLNLLNKETINAMVANLIMKHGADSKEVKFFQRRVENYPNCPLVAEEILNSYFVMYNFNYEAFWNL